MNRTLLVLAEWKNSLQKRSDFENENDDSTNDNNNGLRYIRMIVAKRHAAGFSFRRWKKPAP